MSQRLVWPDPEVIAPFLPTPLGWKVLVVLPHVEIKTDGGLLLPDTVRDDATMAGTVGRVAKLGPHAYDPERFTQGPWVKVGDFVGFNTYAGEVKEAKIGNQHVPEGMRDASTGYFLLKMRVFNDDELSLGDADRMEGWI